MSRSKRRYQKPKLSGIPDRERLAILRQAIAARKAAIRAGNVSEALAIPLVPGYERPKKITEIQKNRRSAAKRHERRMETPEETAIRCDKESREALRRKHERYERIPLEDRLSLMQEKEAQRVAHEMSAFRNSKAGRLLAREAEDAIAKEEALKRAAEFERMLAEWRKGK